MKKAMLILIGLLLSLMLSLPAFANGETDGSDTVTTTVEETVEEETSINKDIGIEVNQNASAEQSAQSESTQSAASSGNDITENADVNSFAEIHMSAFVDVEGIVSVNQSPGSLNNQGNSVSISFAKEGSDTLLHSQSGINHLSSSNRVIAEGSHRENMIRGKAFDSVTGIVGVNQSAGNMNNQNNIASISIGGSSIFALSSADLGMVVSNNTVIETGVTKIDSIVNLAFTGVSGIVSINQSSGNMNNQVNVVTISVHTFP